MQMSKSFQNNGRRSIQIKFRQNSSYEIINSTYLANTLCIKRIFMQSNSEYLEVTRTSKKLIIQGWFWSRLYFQRHQLCCSKDSRGQRGIFQIWRFQYKNSRYCPVPSLAIPVINPWDANSQLVKSDYF